MGRQVLPVPHPVAGVAPPHACPVEPQLMEGLLGMVALGVHELPETVAVPTFADTVQGAEPFMQVVPVCGPQVLWPHS
jgi:hypothetical protein